jgi:hypothetical protein
MLVLFRRFLTESLGVPVEQITLRLNVYTNNVISIREIERYWLQWLELPESSGRNHILNHMPTSSREGAERASLRRRHDPGDGTRVVQQATARFWSTAGSMSPLGSTGP